jgi:hypothetical protein
MSRLQLIVLHVATVIVTLTGIVYAAMKYFVKTDDPFAVANHPLEPYMLAAHVAIAPVLVFAFGWITSSHIVPKLWNTMGGKRYTGLGAAWIAAPMIITGYLLQISSAETLRQVMTIGHWISGGAFVLGYAAHLVVKNRSMY